VPIVVVTALAAGQAVVDRLLSRVVTAVAEGAGWAASPAPTSRPTSSCAGWTCSTCWWPRRREPVLVYYLLTYWLGLVAPAAYKLLAR